ncbi:hypothetical protein N780_02810 [Pontibacillus chungwhensis BH030062]|uniref:G5 domain-containing protein n=1 Tax=Pontibacillus chungwhensis BH030062 TaxID=1385513 RepID=A0A0A2VBB7_9BACI|nr:VanW family protein [Pontibacillus chungwhensis]KGP90965.1 hypothetical protein N780_02810 [Pontibacillus chungwhensis BH030062]
MDKRWDLKFFMYLLAMALFIYGFSVGGAFAYDVVMAGPKTYEEGTKVGGVSVDGLTRPEAENALKTRVQEWLNLHPVEMLTEEQSIVLSEEFLTVDVADTLDNLEEGTVNPLSVRFNRAALEGQKEAFGEEVYDHLLLDQLTADIKSQAEVLSDKSLTYSVYDYVSSGTESLFSVIAEYNQKIPDGSDVFTYTNELDGLVIEPKSNVSLLEQVNDVPLQNQTALNVMASGLYGAVLQTNFDIIQRHISQHLPAYAEKGREASVNLSEGHDFVFFNPNESSYKIQFEVSEETLTVQIVGYPISREYEVLIQNEREIEPRTIIQYSAFATGAEVQREGETGIAYDVFREIYNQNNEAIDTEFITQDYYAPVHTLEVRAEPVEPVTSDNEGTDQSGTGSGDDSGSESNGDNKENQDSGSNENDSDDDTNPNQSDDSTTKEGSKEGSSGDSDDKNEGQNSDGTDGIWSPDEGPSKGE